MEPPFENNTCFFSIKNFKGLGAKKSWESELVQSLKIWEYAQGIDHAGFYPLELKILL